MKNNKKTLVLLFYIVIILLYHVLGYIGHYGFDDMNYAKLASDLNNRIIDFNNHFTFRFPIIILTALSYKLFGISDFASSLPTMIITILTLLLVFKALKNQNLPTIIIGMALTTLSNWFIFYSDKLMTDMYIVLSVMAILLTLYCHKFRSKKQRPILFAILLSLSVFFGFISKGTIILILPLLAYLFITDLIFKRDIKFWIYTIVSGLALLTIYFIAIEWLTGSFLKRFESIAQNSYLNRCSYNEQPIIFLLRRVFYDFFEMLTRQGMATSYIFIIAYMLKRKAWNIFKVETPFAFWATASIILLLSANFMSISLSSYAPMCIDPRHYLYLIPVSAIPAAMIIKEFITDKKLKYSIIAISSVVAIASFFLQGDSFWKLYFPLTILLLGYTFIKPNKTNQKVFSAILIVILSLSPFAMINYAQKIQYREQRSIIKENLLNKNEDCIIVTNQVQKNITEYYTGFGKKNNIEVFTYDEYQNDSTRCSKIFLLKNWYTRYLSNTSEKDLPLYARTVSSNNQLVYSNSHLNIEIWQMHDFSSPELTGTTLLKSTNGFEKDEAYWTKQDENISGEYKYEGEYALHTGQYSSTFVYPVDSVNQEVFRHLIIQADVMCNLFDTSNASLIISIDNEKGSYIWESIGINKYIKAYSKWWPVKYEEKISVSDLKENSVIKVYIWNSDNTTLYIDNFSVKVIGVK
jgi:4-amino-4-deoxy-L-arabinose transferase-like glycosyltransferase